jgi:hypothetical protein
MTRDEVVELFGKMEDRGTSCLGEDLTDWAVAVGMLKLDEPKDTAQRTVDVLNKNLGPNTSAFKIIGALDFAGLKIIEK